ncbi:Transmembrane and immunoglobulin domain-containing protein 1 [Larimichthys crocea]|uniref:Uncharacterized protein n=1 Tax=Larimichthys crocea TaxID=215358 RepID=A0ACD3R4Z3_LARCR|nr:Transmembrane and immunoglobulin domain-containing protein 1 [Larimichthys crocea]
MKLMFRLPLHLLLYCAIQALAVKIQSLPEVNSDGVIQTELEKSVSLVCEPDSSSDPQGDEELVWLRNGAVVNLKEGNKEGRSSVCVTPVIYDDNGATFTCRLGKNTTVSASVTLNVTYAPQISGSDYVMVEEEAELLLQCDIWANPPVSSVSWTLNGIRVDLEAGGFTVSNDGFKSRLSANKAEKRLHEGTYQCSASSSIYGVHTKLFYVTLTAALYDFKTYLCPSARRDVACYVIEGGLCVKGVVSCICVQSAVRRQIQTEKERNHSSDSQAAETRGQRLICSKVSSVSMTSSVMDGVGRAVVGVWRAHTVLDESDGPESSPEAPDRFRKLPSSSSLNSLRMSLRKRLPLRSVQVNSLPENPTWEPTKEQKKTNTVRKLTRSARNSISGVYQRMQRTREFTREECLVQTPGRMCDGDEVGASTSHTPRRTPGRAGATPRRTPRAGATPGRTPGSRGRKTPEAGVRGVRTGGGRRQLVRMAALRSPFASPNTQNQRLKFDQDLESVSSGLKRLKRLSKAFDNIIGRDDSTSTRERSGGAVMRKLDPSGKLSRSNLTRRATNLSTTLGGWAHTAVNTIRKPN